MSKYIKSYSNYVLKDKHQDTNGGKIYERDITTIGGIDHFVQGQLPIYKSGNFIITVNGDISPSKSYINGKWLKNSSGNEEWGLRDTSVNVDDVEKIVLKRDYYKLKDFAYYGSCSELIRSSINNIIDTFPGEMYYDKELSKNINISYTDINNEITSFNTKGHIIFNPFFINITSKDVSMRDINENELKYFSSKETYKKYNFIIDGKNGSSIYDITSVTVTPKNNAKCPGDKTHDVVINYSTNKKVNIEVFIGDKNSVLYFTENANSFHIRPKEEYLNKFHDNLDSFESILMNRYSKPIYKSLFEVINENSFGYDLELKEFIFPLDYGGYNIAVNGAALSTYVNSLNSYADFYDDNFCDNLYRSMTHESIKNFDWSFSRRYNDGDKDDYVEGGSKIQKLIRLFGREFDEIKYYIDGIKDYSRLTYYNSNNMPDYFLKDVLEMDGWDVKHLSVYKNDINNTVSEIGGLTMTPYNVNSQKPYYYTFNKCGYASGKTENAKYNLTEVYDSASTKVTTVIKQYQSNKEYSLKDVNNEFLKLLKLNSKNIFRKKGTIESIESLLAIFGLCSKRWAISKYGKEDEDIDNKYDYEIKEYTMAASGIEDTFIEEKSSTIVNYYNSRKKIQYHDSDYYNGIYVPYRGLMVKPYLKHTDAKTGKIEYFEVYSNFIDSYDLKSKEYKIMLYPYFDKNKELDGNPYYQMKGGWINKEKKFSENNTLLDKTDKTNRLNYFYTETYRNIRETNDIESLLNIPSSTLHKDSTDIIKVNNIENEYEIVDGEVFKIFKDKNNKEYIKLFFYNSQIVINDIEYFGNITYSSNSNGEVDKVNSNAMSDGSEIDVYLNENTNDKSITFFSEYSSISSSKKFPYNDINLSNYFMLPINGDKNKLGNGGWEQLSNDSSERKIIDEIKDYNKANNPHLGGLIYDKGYEYIDYFKRIFKFSNENNLMFKSDNKALDDEAANIGFKIAECSEYMNNDNCSSILEDTKVHYIDNNDNRLKDIDDYEGFKFDDSNITDQIINTKLVDITFRNGENFVLKYYDSIIIEYLQQILPSTLIINIKYK